MRNFFISFLFLTALGVLGFTLYSTSVYRTPAEYVETTVVIAPGTGAQQTLVKLHEAGVTPPMLVTALPVVISHQYSALKAGEYHFVPGLTPAQIIGQIARGEVVVHKITVPEGWNSYQLRTALMAEPLLTGELGAIPEGSVLPDTMHFTRGEARSAVVERMQKAQRDFLTKVVGSRDADLPVTSVREILTLASIVEKETGVASERAMVAGVFTNRLRRGMMLQSDPTVVYGVEAKQGGAPMGRPISKTDLVTETPYNSYTRAGLPPTPICNPGKAAIEAVLHPATTDALYFVATGTGGHNFAATLAEHERNVGSYHAVMKDEPVTPARPLKKAPAKNHKRR